MRRKKTSNVKEFHEWANKQLARTDAYATDEFKAGICTALEHVLHGSGNYKGYNNLYWLRQGCDEWEAAGRPDFPEKDKYIDGNLGKYARVYYF